MQTVVKWRMEKKQRGRKLNSVLCLIAIFKHLCTEMLFVTVWTQPFCLRKCARSSHPHLHIKKKIGNQWNLLLTCTKCRIYNSSISPRMRFFFYAPSRLIYFMDRSCLVHSLTLMGTSSRRMRRRTKWEMLRFHIVCCWLVDGALTTPTREKKNQMLVLKFSRARGHM